MVKHAVSSSPPTSQMERVLPYGEEAEMGVLGSILLDSVRVMDLCIERGLVPEAFYVPANRIIYDTCTEMSGQGNVIDVLLTPRTAPEALPVDCHL